MNKKYDFLLAGVGGQGTILASNILAGTGQEMGYDIKTAEVHGMAQRGGSVESHVRWGEKVASSLVEQGKVDYLVGFEMLEAARWPMYLNKDSVVLVNHYRIPPPAVNLGKAEYPSDEEIKSILTKKGSKLLFIDATDIASKLGNPTMIGVVLLGALSTLVGGAEEVWLEVIKRLVPEKFVESNLEAFKAGRAANLY